MTSREPSPEPSSEPLKEIPESIFADDDGSADPRLAQTLIKYSHRKAPLADVVDALAYARLMIPVLATGDERFVGVHGLEQDAVASTGVVAVQMPDGRAALPVFTDVQAALEWNRDVRPIPAEGPRAALAAIAEGWASLVINPGRESVVIPRPAVWALGQGLTWTPAVNGTEVAADVVEDVRTALTLDADLRGVDIVPGDTAEVLIVLRLAPGLTQPEVNSVVERVQRELAASDTIAQRIDSLQLKLAPADAS